MVRRLTVVTTSAVITACGLVAWQMPLNGQGTPRAASARAATGLVGGVPRTPDGHPDLQGTYDLATMTPVERAAVYNGRPAIPVEEARRIEAAAAARTARALQPDSADRAAPPVGGDGSTGAAGGVGGYNAFWIDRGNAFTVIDGQARTSIVVDPPDGRVPPFTPAARARQAAQRNQPTSDQAETAGGDVGLETAAGAYDDPERRPLAERCILGFGSTSGPPALPNYFYNNLHQIVQTKDTVMILTEMNHDARMVRMNSQHLPASIRGWMGDSIGWWEGDTLVVETTNFTDKTRFRGSTDKLKVTERFSRIDPKTLLYRFTVEDPDTWSRPWTGEYTWPATDDLIYEYACHEANYAMGNILRGARQREADARKGSGR
ncbi:MAG: hypothetical protein JSU08_02990 [Acidobacteria bacterium]|nr:hypothetical protein [Acidobacteriota bacterium]